MRCLLEQVNRDTLADALRLCRLKAARRMTERSEAAGHRKPECRLSELLPRLPNVPIKDDGTGEGEVT